MDKGIFRNCCWILVDIKMKNITNKTLKELKDKGWEDGEIKYAPFKVLIKGDYGIIYSEQTDKVIVKYYRGKRR